MSEDNAPDVAAIAGRLSPEALMLAYAWFSFGRKATVTSSPPHAMMNARKAEIDELLSYGLITIEHDHDRRIGRDNYIIRGTEAIFELNHSERSKEMILRHLMEKNDAQG